jgi:DNA-binding MarR family transcriptional regulator
MKYTHHMDRAAALDQLLEVAMLVNADMNGSLPALGLTPARTHVVWVLLHRGPSTQRVLAEELGVSARNVTGLVDALVETGFVTREPHPSDRRATLVTLTDHGRTVADQMARDHEGFAALLFDAMPPSTFEGFSRGLSQVLDTLRRHVAVPPGG